MRSLILLLALSFILTSSASRSTEAPTGFDNKSNGVTDVEDRKEAEGMFRSPEEKQSKFITGASGNGSE